MAKSGFVGGAEFLGDAADPAAHDAWFRAKVHEALNNLAPPIPHEDVEAHFARRRAALRPKPR